MNRYLLALATLSFICPGASGQTKPVIAIIGSSTAVGTGATPIDSSWVNLTKYYFKGLNEIDTIYNRAVGATITADGASAGPDTGIIWVMANDKPDLVIVSYASNDAASDIPLDSTMAHLRFIYQYVTNAGKICWITTPHPRDYLNAGQNGLQLQAVDSTFAEFPNFNLDFWSPLVAPGTDTLDPLYNSGDGVHPNNAGYQLLFQVVKNSDILAPFFPLALTQESFSAVPQGQDVLLNWTTAAAGPVHFVIQRSADGDSYNAIGQQESDANLPGTRYSWQDVNPLPGRSYYRLQTTASGAISYSPVVSLEWKGKDWAIGDIYLPEGGTQLTVTIQSSKNRNITMGVFDVTGRLISSQAGYVGAPETRFSISVSTLAQGQYFLRIISADGMVGARAFLKW
jgi:lysophospholipase L1-like esterase